MTENRSKPLKVLFFPDGRKGNPYQDLLRNGLAEHGIEVEFAEYMKGLFPLNRALRNRGRINVVHLHWINRLIAPIFWNRKRASIFAKLSLIIADILILRLRGIRVVWTIHNLVSHESPDVAVEIAARRLLARVCSNVILHSIQAKTRVEETYKIDLSGKSHIIPHGNYEGCYPYCDDTRLRLVKDFKLNCSQDVVVLFFGVLRPYKGLRRLIKAFSSVQSSKLKLIIAGSPHSRQFVDEILVLAAPDERIHVMPRFVPSTDVAALFSLANVVALPFENTLTSGSVVLALTLGKPLILPDEARALGIVNDNCALFFDSSDTLKIRLQELDKASLLKLERSIQSLSDEYSWKRVSDLTQQAYGLHSQNES